MSKRKLSLHCLHLDSKQLIIPCGADTSTPKLWPSWPAAWEQNGVNKSCPPKNRAAQKLFLLAHLLLPPSKHLGSRGPSSDSGVQGTELGSIWQDPNGAGWIQGWVIAHTVHWGRHTTRKGQRKVPINRRMQSVTLKGKSLINGPQQQCWRQML